MQRVQDPNRSNVDNLNNVRREASRHSRNKKKKYLRAKIEELETKSKIKNIRDLCRDINDFKKSYQHETNVVWDEKGNLVTDSYSILARWRNHFSQLFNVHRVNYVRQTEIDTAEPLVPEPSTFEVEMATEKVKRHKSTGTDQIPAALWQGVGQFNLRPIKLLILFGIRRNCLRSGRSRTMHLLIRRAIKQIVVIIKAHHFRQLRTKFYPTSCCQD